MDLGLEGKIGVITAASKGLGKAAAEALAKEKVNLTICSRDENRIKQTANEISEKYKTKVLPFVCDVRSKDDIERLKDNVIKEFGTVHILFTNAGGPPSGKALDFTSEDYEEAIKLNLLSTINLIYAFLPYMRNQKWGRIIASTSISVKQPIPTIALSNVSRVGIIAFIKSLIQEISKDNITANIVAPGYIMTDRVIELLKVREKNEGKSFEELLKELAKNTPLNRIGKPEEFGALVAFLSSELAGYINGETILIDGGMYKGLF